MEDRLSRYLSEAGRCGVAVPDEMAEALALPLRYSDFMARVAAAFPGWPVQVWREGFHRCLGPRQYARRFAQEFAANHGVGLEAALRRFRNRELFRIAWRDASGAGSVREILWELSSLAQVLLSEALSRLRAEMEMGEARGSLVVLGLGKLGGRELNFSSDVDLMFAFSGCGEGGQVITDGEFFERVARRFVKILSFKTPDGIVYRVDTRLRPFGDAGPLVLSFDSMEEYYQSHGREWERYALVKARPVAGDIGAGLELLDRLRPFVYRRYLDFSSVEALREMKAMIQREVELKGLEENLKLGRGGIREIEFMVQAVQLIYGGKDKDLQTPSLLRALEVVEEKGYLPGTAAVRLRDAYLFLRRVENLIQMQDDLQLHTLPSQPERLDLLARITGYDSREEFCSAIDSLRQEVSSVFDAFLGSDRPPSRSMVIWEPDLPAEQGERIAAGLGYGDPRRAFSLIHDLRTSKMARSMGERALGYLGRVAIKALELCAGGDEPEELLLRVVEVLHSIGRRSSYFAVLAEEPAALERLVSLCSRGRWVSRFVGRHPIVIDDLLAPGGQGPLPKEEYLDELRRLLGHCSDTECFLEETARFKLLETFRLALDHTLGSLDARGVGGALTGLAEAIMAVVLEESASFLRERGYPLAETPPVTVVGYGKFGGRELGFGSDLDLVFLYGGDADGSDPSLYTRLWQRMIHLLTTYTSQGRLYEVDMRLRPDGDAGVLVTSVDSFFRYQQEAAWTWEHQALVRARPVAGNTGVARAFWEGRKRVLSVERDRKALKQGIVEMRRKMARSQGMSSGFHIKRDRGGLVDVEFMVQYLVLAYGAHHPELTEETSTLAIIDLACEAGLLGRDAASVLKTAFLAYMEFSNRVSLESGEPVVMDGAGHDRLLDLKEAVIRLWKELLEG